MLHSIFSNKLLLFCYYSDDGGRQSSAGLFAGGFLLGGIIVGALGWVYAPQVTASVCYS